MKRQRDECHESASFVLKLTKFHQMLDALGGGFNMPVKQCGSRGDSQFMRSSVNIKPGLTHWLFTANYFTDIIEIANRENIPVKPVVAEDPGEVMGVNTPEELQTAENWRRKLSL